jgi:hypothetical protein
MAALTNTVSAPEDSDGVGVVLRGDGHATEAEMAGGDGLVPGQAVERIFRISNRSDDDFRSITLRTVATRTSLLDSDPVNGLQLSLDACSVPWEERLDDSYSCSGREAVVLAPRPVIGDVALDGLSTTRPGGSDHPAPDDVASGLGGQPLPRSDVTDPLQLQRAFLIPKLKGSVVRPRHARRRPVSWWRSDLPPGSIVDRLSPRHRRQPRRLSR